jgi:hypothetical protein
LKLVNFLYYFIRNRQAKMSKQLPASAGQKIVTTRKMWENGVEVGSDQPVRGIVYGGAIITSAKG